MSLSVLMALGPFIFSINTTAYDELTRSRSWKFAAHEIIGKYPALQPTGPDVETMTLRGTTCPGFKVAGYAMLETMAAKADTGDSMLLISGYGLVFGFYVIEKIDQTEKYTNQFGAPRKVDFTITLKKTSDTAATIRALATSVGSAVSSLL